MVSKRVVPLRGLLIHITHYDPDWCLAKSEEEPFDVGVALQVVDAMAAARMNLLIVDCADGVAYKSHPELKRHYTVPMNALRGLVAAANARGIDVVPKLNFAKSGRNVHDMWMCPHWDAIRWHKHNAAYWRVAGDLIDELVDVCRPRQYFHIGMDEDHDRSLRQYVADIKALRKMIRKHRLRAVMWNDSCHDSITAVAQVHAEKIRAVEDLLPKDIVQTLWDYAHAHPAIAKRVVGKGFGLWAAPGREAEQVRRWKRALHAVGGTGLVMTNWVKCSERNRALLLDQVSALGLEYL